jgi:uncharacterized protein YndB with AHSA1/START domain
MRTFSTSIDIAAPPDRVWRIMSDVERWHEWTASIGSIRRLDSGPLQPGARAYVRQPKLPPAHWRVTDVQPGREFTWISRSPGVLVTARHLVEPAAAGSRATLSIHYGGALGWLIAKLVRGITDRYIAMEADGLKRRSEA